MEQIYGALKQNKIRQDLRIAPFVSFLKSKIPEFALPDHDFTALRNWVCEQILVKTSAAHRGSHYLRRDMAILSCLCVAPEKGSPRYWAKDVLRVSRDQAGSFSVSLWKKKVEFEGPRVALLYWNTWRARFDRPEKSGLSKKRWVGSELLFPNAAGGNMSKHAMRNALLRLRAKSAPSPERVTPALIQKAFLQHWEQKELNEDWGAK